MFKENLIQSVTDQEQHAFIKTLCLLDKGAATIHDQLLKDLSRRALAERTVRQWVHSFHNVRTSTKAAEQSGRQKIATDEAHRVVLEELLLESRSWSARELAFRLGIGSASVH
jgi:transposase